MFRTFYQLIFVVLIVMLSWGATCHTPQKSCNSRAYIKVWFRFDPSVFTGPCPMSYSYVPNSQTQVICPPGNPTVAYDLVDYENGHTKYFIRARSFIPMCTGQGTSWTPWNTSTVQQMPSQECQWQRLVRVEDYDTTVEVEVWTPCAACITGAYVLYRGYTIVTPEDSYDVLVDLKMAPKYNTILERANDIDC